MERKDYRVVMTVKEIYYVTANTRKGALLKAELFGNPSEAKVISKTVRHINKNS